MNIYISNLNSSIKDQDLKDIFSPFGEVTSAKVQQDVFTGTSRGFGYVEMSDALAGQKAIDALNESTLEGLQVAVLPAEPKKELKGSYKVGNGPVTAYKFRKN